MEEQDQTKTQHNSQRWSNDTRKSTVHSKRQHNTADSCNISDHHTADIPGISNTVIVSPDMNAKLTCVYKRNRATPICKGKLEI